MKRLLKTGAWLIFSTVLAVVPAISYAQFSSGTIKFHGAIVENSTNARNQCLQGAIEHGISQKCVEKSGTIIHVVVTDSQEISGTLLAAQEYTLRRVVMKYD